jgi:radical SAM protein with 4Fe4S-binding SPASM domain
MKPRSASMHELCEFPIPLDLQARTAASSEAYLESYFFLSDKWALVRGARHSLVFDLDNDTAYRANDLARDLLDLGEKGLRISEAAEALGMDPSLALTFVEQSCRRGLLIASAFPRGSSQESLPDPGLDFLWIEVSSRCNLRCIHCYAGSDAGQYRENLPSDEIKRAIDEAASLGCKHLQFTGGECTLRPDLLELIVHARSRNFQFIEVFTNGTNLSDDLVRNFASAKIHAAVSIYSFRQKTHDAITGVPGSFERTVEGLKLLLAYDVPTRCAVVAMRQNESDLEGTVYFLSRLGVMTRPPDPIRPSGRGKGSSNWPRSYGLKSLMTAPGFSFNRVLFEKNRRWNSCWYGKAAITSSGDVIPCVFSRDQVAGNLRGQSLRDVILGEKMQEFWSVTRDQVDVCRDCEYRYLCADCRPWAYGLSGKLEAKSPWCTYNPYSGEWEKPSGNLF